MRTKSAPGASVPRGPYRVGWVLLSTVGLGVASCAVSGGGSTASPAASRWGVQSDSFDSGAGTQFGVSVPARSLAEAEAPSLAALPAESTTQPRDLSERRLVHSGEITLAVGDLEIAAERASSIARELDGYVQQWTSEFVLLRIPAPSFDVALERVSALGSVVDRNLRVQDVTEEYQDIELQLGTLRVLATRLTALLERAENVEAALAVERELGRVRGEIERLEGRLASMANRVQFATLQVGLVLVSERRARGPGLPFGWLQELGVERLLGVRR